jgi:hypothetical protein
VSAIHGFDQVIGEASGVTPVAVVILTITGESDDLEQGRNSDAEAATRGPTADQAGCPQRRDAVAVTACPGFASTASRSRRQRRSAHQRRGRVPSA